MSTKARTILDHPEPTPDSSENSSSEPATFSEDPETALLRVNKTKLEIAKLESELKKLGLERRLSEDQLSWKTRILEWIKAGTVFAALVGVVATVYLGQQQAKIARETAERQSSDAEENRAADRFDKALSRLADKNNPGSRMTGVAGLRLFLNGGHATHQKEALHYLVTALATEASPDVQQAILSAFTDLGKLTQNAKDDALRTAIEIDRSLTGSAVTRYNDGLGKQIADMNHGDQLTFIQKLQQSTADPIVHELGPAMAPLVSAMARPLSPEEKMLDNYVQLVNDLLRAGARNNDNDWTNIYCQACDFTYATDLSGAHFDGSFLSRANFTHVTLDGATFRNADLSETVFFASNLTGADLSWNLPLGPAIYNAAQKRSLMGEPYLECAMLYGTKLDNLPLLSILGTVAETTDRRLTEDLDVSVANMRGTQSDEKTRITRLGFRLKTRFPIGYYDALKSEEKKQFEADFFGEGYWWSLISGAATGFGITSGRMSPSGERKGTPEYIEHAVYGSTQTLTSQNEQVNHLLTAAFKEAQGAPFWGVLPVTREIFKAPVTGSPKTEDTEGNPGIFSQKVDCSGSGNPHSMGISGGKIQLGGLPAHD